MGPKNSDSYTDNSVSSVHKCDLTHFDKDCSVAGVPNRNVNWIRGGSSSQWFGTYVQWNFTLHRLNCFVDLVCILFCLFYIIITAMNKAFCFLFFLSFFFFF